MNAPVIRRRGAVLGELARAHLLRPLDTEVGRLLLDLDAGADDALGVAAAAASLAVAQGHSCLPLAELPALLAATAPLGASVPPVPSVAAVRAALSASALVGDGTDDARTALVLDADERLYLGRYFRYETRVAAALRALASAPATAPVADADALRALLARHFRLDAAQPDAQALAVLCGLISPLTVITGGPGTGKTSTVASLLAALVEQAVSAGDEAPRMCLAAPTGKAAARLGESLRTRVADLDCSEAVRRAIPTDAATVHRLLGSLSGSTRFRHRRGHPLDADVVVVDEASMIDLPLMARLLDALPAGARLVLLGDRDQLAAVEAGNVLDAICTAAGDGGMSRTRAELTERVTGWRVPVAEPPPPLADAMVELRLSYRFGADSGLGQLAACIRRGDVDAVLVGLRRGGFDRVAFEPAASTLPAARVVEHYADAFAALADETDPASALRAANRFRVLTALREGPTGCATLNAALERRLCQRAGVAADEAWYAGRLLLISENAYGTDLYNGDIGIVLPAADGRLVAWFEAASGGVRSLPLATLPAHESAFAMTIHKSQGSEFDEVMVVLPSADTRVLGRELLYTAVTRARSRVRLLASDDALRRAVSRSNRRHGGLADRLTTP